VIASRRRGHREGRAVPIAAAIALGFAFACAASAAVAAATAAGPSSAARELSDRKRVEGLFDEWRFDEGHAALAALAKAGPDAPDVLYLQGYEQFLAGDYEAAVAKLKAAALAAPKDADVQGLTTLAEGARDAVKGHREERSSHFVIRFPAEDEPVIPYAIDALEAAYAALHADLGFAASRPVRVDIYRSPYDLADVSSLSRDEVRTTGTIALCKWARLMVTTPRALMHGYPWLDTLSHELVHYAVSSLSRDKAPVWLQEGLAKFEERRWRGPAGERLPPTMEHILAKGLAADKLISFDAMHPSMAKLPSSEATALAFAEVATAVGHLHARGGIEALRAVIAQVRDGVDAREAVAAGAEAGTWAEFERGWKSFMAAQRYRTFPGMDPPTRKIRKAAAIASKRRPSEDEDLGAALNHDPSERLVTLGNMLLRRNRVRAAAVEYEKAARGRPPHWLIAVKLGRAYLLLGEPARALAAVEPARTLYAELPGPSLIAGQALLALGDVPKAVVALQTSMAINPFDPAAHCALAEAHGKLPAGAEPAPAQREREARLCQTLAE